jgi:hypothetical protein
VGKHPQGASKDRARRLTKIVGKLMRTLRPSRLPRVEPEPLVLGLTALGREAAKGGGCATGNTFLPVFSDVSLACQRLLPLSVSCTRSLPEIPRQRGPQIHAHKSLVSAQVGRRRCSPGGWRHQSTNEKHNIARTLESANASGPARRTWGRAAIVGPSGDEFEVWGDSSDHSPERLARTKIAVDGLKSGTRVRVLFEDRELKAADGTSSTISAGRISISALAAALRPTMATRRWRCISTRAARSPSE